MDSTFNCDFVSYWWRLYHFFVSKLNTDDCRPSDGFVRPGGAVRAATAVAMDDRVVACVLGAAVPVDHGYWTARTRCEHWPHHWRCPRDGPRSTRRVSNSNGWPLWTGPRRTLCPRYDIRDGGIPGSAPSVGYSVAEHFIHTWQAKEFFVLRRV